MVPTNVFIMTLWTYLWPPPNVHALVIETKSYGANYSIPNNHKLN